MYLSAWPHDLAPIATPRGPTWLAKPCDRESKAAIFYSIFYYSKFQHILSSNLAARTGDARSPLLLQITWARAAERPTVSK